MGNRGFGTISLKAGTATRPFRVWRDTCRTGWDKEINEESLEPGRPHPFTTSAHCAEGTVIPELVFPATQGALRVQLIRARYHSLSRLKHAKGQLKQSPTRPIWSDHDWTTHEIDNWGSWRGVPNPSSQPKFGPNPRSQANFCQNPSYQIFGVYNGVICIDVLDF